MGIPSLTKYLEDRSQQYFEKFELYNCSLVIDGNNICKNLYNWQYAYWKSGYSPYCYGGDYDKYAEIVKQFFRLLSECNVTPFILFDSCSENDKAPLVKLSLNEKAKINSKITPASTQATYGVGAVALRYAFQDVVKELGLKVYTCISNANRIIACLAKHLNCPVLSTDSDFFVSGAMFVPFSSIDYPNRDYDLHSYKSIACKIYKIENLMNALNNRPNMHYLIPVLLGNHQFSTDIFNPFFKQSRIFGGRQKRLDLTFHWLKKQRTIETAINEILKIFISEDQKLSTLKVIKSIVMGYTPDSTTSVLNYFHIKAKEGIATSFNFEKVEEALGLTMEKAADINDIQVSELFEKKFTECKYPEFFMDMLLENRYFVWPNIEDCSKPDANSIGYNIMSAIHNILVQADEKRLTVLRRNTDIKLEEFLLPAYKDSLPSIEEIDYLRLERKQDFIFGILEIDKQFSEIFESLPKEWHLFILSLKYATSNSQFNSSFIYSLILCFITLNYIDPKLKGFYRSIVDLQDTHNISQNFEEIVEGTKFSTISEDDSRVFMQKVVKYFEKDAEDNAETYDRGIMHSIAEVQCVFLHLKHLNSLFNFPFKDVFIYKVFDGTFIYNMAKYFEGEREISVKNYISIFLKDCLNIYCVVISIIELLEKHSIAIKL